MSDKYLQQDLINFFNGAVAGCLSGFVVGPIEFTKVTIQTQHDFLKSQILTKGYFMKMVNSIPAFCVSFSSVCAIEFAINEKIRQKFGSIAGIVSSALTGAFFLTGSDHLMFRSLKGENCKQSLKHFLNTSRHKNNRYNQINPFALWTGLTPMIAREMIFITSVMYLGPRLGQLLLLNLHRQSNQSLQQNHTQKIIYDSMGRTLTGIVTTFISQPFDVLTRQMQKQLFANPQICKITWINCLKNMNLITNNGKINKLKPLFKGVIPRIGLATMGGVLAGGLFDFLSSLNFFKLY